MLATESAKTQPIRKEAYNRLRDVEEKLRVLDSRSESLSREDTGPIDDDDIRASIEAAAKALVSKLNRVKIYQDAVSAFWAACATAELGHWFGGQNQVADHKWQILHDKLDSLSQLDDHWDGYSAPPPSEEACLNAREFLQVLSLAELLPKRCKPSVVGGIGITFRHGDRKVYVEFYNDGRIHTLNSDGVTEPITGGVDPSYSAYLRLVKEIRDYLNA